MLVILKNVIRPLQSLSSIPTFQMCCLRGNFYFPYIEYD